jgi:hypothetical protein
VVVVAGAGAELLEATRSQEGHMESVVAGRCMYKGFIVLSARSSATSFCNRRFSSVSVSQQRFRYSQSTSVCFSFVLRKDTLLTPGLREFFVPFSKYGGGVCVLRTSLCGSGTRLPPGAAGGGAALPAPASASVRHGTRRRQDQSRQRKNV